MATAKKTRKDVKKPAVKTSLIKKTAAVKSKEAVSSPKREKVSSKTNATPKHVKKVAQKLPRREAKIQQIRLKLLQQRETLLNEAEVALNELPGQTIFPDLGDQASAETDRNFMLRLRGREQRLLKKIDQAIERVDSGTFGICEDCGSEINLKRLEARPVTTMCTTAKPFRKRKKTERI
jgi:DnaK suppressor protein